jgi:hypothetical protein
MVVNVQTQGGWNRFLLLLAATMAIYWSLGEWNVLAVARGMLPLGVLVGWWTLRDGRWASWVTLGYTVLVGMIDRLGHPIRVDSDVWATTSEAINVLAHGHNPYAHYYLAADPSTFPYLPGEIAFYAVAKALSGGVLGADRWTGIGIIFLLAGLAFCIGPSRAAVVTGLYATLAIAGYYAVDGSNDTSLAFLVVLAVVLLACSERANRGSRAFLYASAFVFAWALLFKQFAWLIYPFVILYLRQRGNEWRGYLAVGFGVVALGILPFLATAPVRFIEGVVGQLGAHHQVVGLNFWKGMEIVAPSLVHKMLPVMPITSLIAIVLVGGVLLMRPASNLGFALLQGLSLLFVALFFERWATANYYIGASAILAASLALVPLPLVNQTDTNGRHDGGIP